MSSEAGPSSAEGEHRTVDAAVEAERVGPDELHAAIDRARQDEAFMTLLTDFVERDKAILDRLADPG